MTIITNIKQIVRTLLRRKLITSINVLGLGIGLGSVILLTMFLIHEFSFDQYHTNSSRMYRVVSEGSCGSYYAMGEALKTDVPEIEKLCRITNVSDVWTVIMKHDNQNYPLSSFVAADPELLDILDIESVQGQVNEHILSPTTILISDKVAKKYFGNKSPIGESLEFNISKSNHLLQVVGVYKSFPTYSSFQADFICDMSIAFAQFEDLEFNIGVRKEKRAFDFFTQWERHNSFSTFVLLHKNTDVSNVEEKCFEICNEHKPDWKEEKFKLQSFKDMYLHSEELKMVAPLKRSQFKSLKIFMSIGLLILLVACFNYILISNTEQKLSIKDIACRKINGASAWQVFTKVMLKSFLLTYASLIPAILFVALSLPIFNNYFHEELSLSVLWGWQYLVALFLITSFTALFSGAYLSYAAHNTNPVELLKRQVDPKQRNFTVSNILVMLQFIVFILLICCTLLMNRQMHYSLDKDLGFETENMMAVELGSERLKSNYQSICNEILNIANVIDCQPTTVCFPSSDNVFVYEYNDREKNKGVRQDIILLAPGNIELFGIELLDGVSFNESNAKNRNNFILNKAAAIKHGVTVGEQIAGFDIIGVVGNFHLKSIHSPIVPIFIIAQAVKYPYLMVKTDGEMASVSSRINDILQMIEPGYYFEPEILSDKINDFYKKDKQQTAIISLFSFVALFLAFIGLLGFVSLTLSTRVKEIGVRKVNGATISEILLMLNKDFIKWVAIAFVIAVPIAYYAMSKWLENFAYKTQLSWWIFALAGVLALGFALLTVSWQSWKAARRNPIESLRYE